MRLWGFIFLVGLFGAQGAVLRAKRESETTSNSESSAGYSDTGNRKKRGLLNEEQVSVNCRTVVVPDVGPDECYKIKFAEIGTDPIEEKIWKEKIGSHHTLARKPGRCRLDPWQYAIDPSKACLCVATKDTCEKGRRGCYWHESYKTGHRECISKAEKFYNMLYALLKVRGKKNFAINIRYGATAARGDLPYGPYGPAIIGMGNPNPSTKFGVYKGRFPQPQPMQGYPQAMHGRPHHSPSRGPHNSQYDPTRHGLRHGMASHGAGSIGHQQPGMNMAKHGAPLGHQLGMPGQPGSHGPGMGMPPHGGSDREMSGHHNPMEMGHGMASQHMGGPGHFGMHGSVS